jgi:acyl-CoA synthetase (AMP-forming)/AMP-acid ligase II
MTAPALLHHLLDNAADWFPRRPAVHDPDGSVTWAELRMDSERLAGWLRRSGVRRGDRVIMAVPPSRLVPALGFACSRAGAVFVPLGEETAGAIARHMLTDAAPALLVTDGEALRAVAATCGVPCVSTGECRSAPTGGPAPEAEALAVDPAAFIYTSGSTAMPKAVVSTHQQMTFAARAIQSRLRYRPEDVVWCGLPLSFDYGLYQIFLCALSGAALHLPRPGSAGQWLATGLRSAGATVLPAVPSLAASLARLLARRATPLPALRLLTNTGAAMPRPLTARLRECLPCLRIQLMYGLTECKRATIMPPDEDLHRPDACGVALPGTEVYVAGPDGERLPTGTVGEVVVRGPHVMAGYWRQPELTARRFPRAHGLFPELRTGDYGRIDADGYLYFTGRHDGLYKERGHRVSTEEVTAAAYRVAGITAAVVLPPEPGEAGATLVVTGSLPPDEALRGMRTELDEAKIPARCLVVGELPLTSNGKVAHVRLRALARSAGHV